MDNRKKVLIIDDEIDLCLLLKSYFVRKSYDVYLSHTLEEGMSFLERLQPNIVFLDNNLPDGTGWSMAPKIASSYPEIYINMISGFHPSIPTMPSKARYSVIEKPISFSDLDKQLTNIV